MPKFLKIFVSNKRLKIIVSIVYFAPALKFKTKLKFMRRVNFLEK